MICLYEMVKKRYKLRSGLKDGCMLGGREKNFFYYVSLLFVS